MNGQQTTYAWDDEDRLTSITTPSGTSSFTYNGLGLRTGKTDSTGIYAYVCDGTTPGSPVLADGLAVYTPGLSDHRGSASTFSHGDLLGSLRFLTDSGQNVTANLLPDAFGETVSQAGSVLTPFGWNGASGYQSDSDGLKLLGHRYYDSRTGRFITQDHAKSGGNWYAYAGNNPVNKKDPLGLAPRDGRGSSPVGSPGYSGDTGGVANQEDDYESEVNNQQVDQNIADQATAMLNALALLAPSMADVEGSVSVGFSLSGGFFRFNAGCGVAYDFVTGQVEFFHQSGVYVGTGLGASFGLGASIGNDTLGNFGGFNGPSNAWDILSADHGFFGGVWNSNYKGIEIGPPGIPGTPFEFTQQGVENGMYYGTSNTTPFGPSYTFPLPSIPTLHF